jgi:hypothetical protein
VLLLDLDEEAVEYDFREVDEYVYVSVPVKPAFAHI